MQITAGTSCRLIPCATSHSTSRVGASRAKESASSPPCCKHDEALDVGQSREFFRKPEQTQRSTRAACGMRDQKDLEVARAVPGEVTSIGSQKLPRQLAESIRRQCLAEDPSEKPVARRAAAAAIFPELPGHAFRAPRRPREIPPFWLSSRSAKRESSTAPAVSRDERSWLAVCAPAT